MDLERLMTKESESSQGRDVLFWGKTPAGLSLIFPVTQAQEDDWQSGLKTG